MARISFRDGIHVIFSKFRGVDYVPFTKDSVKEHSDRTIEFERYVTFYISKAGKLPTKKHDPLRKITRGLKTDKRKD